MIFSLFQERVSDSSMKSAQVAARPNVPPYGMPMIPMDNDDGVSYKGFVSTFFVYTITCFGLLQLSFFILLM